MVPKSLGKEVNIYSGDDVFTGKLISLQPDSLVYEDEDGKHLLPLSDFSLVISDTKDITHEIEKEKKRIFRKFLLVDGGLFVLGVIIGILMRGI